MPTWLEIEDGPEAGKRIDVPVDAEDIVLGRAPDCGGVVAAPSVSRKHARLRREGERFRIEDLGSANGTFVNGRRLDQPVDLNDQDRIALGAVKILFVSPPPPPEPEGDATIAITPTQGDATIVTPAPAEPAPPPRVEPPPPRPEPPPPPPSPKPPPETKPASPPPEPPPPPRPPAPPPPKPEPPPARPAAPPPTSRGTAPSTPVAAEPASMIQTATTRLRPQDTPSILELVAIAVGSFLAVFGLGWWLL